MPCAPVERVSAIQALTLCWQTPPLRSRPQKGFKRMKLQRRLMKSFQWTSSRRLKESIATIESNMYYDYTEYYVGPAIMTGDQMKVNNRPQRAHFGLCYGGKLPVYSSGFWVEHHMRHMRTFCFCFVFFKIISIFTIFFSSTRCVGNHRPCMAAKRRRAKERAAQLCSHAQIYVSAKS